MYCDQENYARVVENRSIFRQFLRWLKNSFRLINCGIQNVSILNSDSSFEKNIISRVPASKDILNDFITAANAVKTQKDPTFALSYADNAEVRQRVCKYYNMLRGVCYEYTKPLKHALLQDPIARCLLLSFILSLEDSNYQPLLEIIKRMIMTRRKLEAAKSRKTEEFEPDKV